MSLKEIGWVANCDEPGCTEELHLGVVSEARCREILEQVGWLWFWDENSDLRVWCPEHRATRP